MFVERIDLRSAPKMVIASLSVTLFTLATSLTLHAQDPAKDKEAGPVWKELEEFREKSSKTAPPDRLRIYEEGIEEVR
jgi:hypothetical protein